MQANPTASPNRHPSAALVLREHGGTPFYEAKFRVGGRQVKRRIGEAWLERSGDGWKPRRGRVQPGCYDERSAHVRAAEIVALALNEHAVREQLDEDRKTRGTTFRELACEYRRWLGAWVGNGSGAAVNGV